MVVSMPTPNWLILVFGESLGKVPGLTCSSQAGSRPLGVVQEPLSQKRKACTTVHHALERFELVDFARSRLLGSREDGELHARHHNLARFPQQSS